MADIEQLNADCTCVTLDRDLLCRALVDAVGDAAFCDELAIGHPHLLSAQSLFLSAEHGEQMQAVIRAIEYVTQLAPYRDAVLAYAPEIAGYAPGPVGVFMGYDFHVGPDGPRLIEINTNAGGALINAFVRQAHHACCAAMATAFPIKSSLPSQCESFVDSFGSEWLKQGRGGQPETIAIVDHAPSQQYLFPEFVLFKRLFEQHGIRATIAAPEQLAHQGGVLWLGRERIDLVYNRLTDFDLSHPGSGAMRQAYLAGDVVVTPNPRAHALFADKRNLVLLSETALLKSWDTPADVVETLQAGIPRTRLVTPASADELWAQRNSLFFKPRSGFGGRAAYRGDKLTRKVWGEILAGGYVAQQIVQPSSRTISIDGKVESLKADLRCYTYDGNILMIAARLYRGQTTNFRTPGGGFAPVFLGQGHADCMC